MDCLSDHITFAGPPVPEGYAVLMEAPELRDDFILRMKDIDLEKSIPVEDFGKRYQL